ncbi:hypothetical protein KPH14_001870 [Odynerus spinipes]|uniref:Salivary secreted peptide n=1 Tax=Odynerus spinipes TaxID=1348599 RepID=A0AAD9RZW9_9HYME|nr:hypothetical protein KPH14_001870 [Odynerus spinipes]
MDRVRKKFPERVFLETYCTSIQIGKDKGTIRNPVIALVLVVAAAMAVEVVPRVHMENYAAANKSHNLVIGYRMPGDRLVLRQNIEKKSSWLQIVTVEKTFNTTRYDVITQVNAFDQRTDGTGAYASVLNGGPGHRNVSMRFKSQRNHGIHFVVEIYARP